MLLTQRNYPSQFGEAVAKLVLQQPNSDPTKTLTAIDEDDRQHGFGSLQNQ